jgi:mannose-6-phosphate isomerase-like protein (cupin superfamily)
MSAQLVPAVEKIWGETRCIRRDRAHEVHHASILMGGYSSRHHHRKLNLFYVISGTLEVHRYDPDEHPVVLTAGMAYTVESGRAHRFNAITDVELLEIYWMDDLDPEDIVRVDVGGLVLPM